MSGKRLDDAPSFRVARSSPVPHSPTRYIGIFGFYFYDVRHTKGEILDTLFEGLKRLEYRGYDSAGVSLDLPVQSARKSFRRTSPS